MWNFVFVEFGRGISYMKLNMYKGIIKTGVMCRMLNYWIGLMLDHLCLSLLTVNKVNNCIDCLYYILCPTEICTRAHNQCLHKCLYKLLFACS